MGPSVTFSELLLNGADGPDKQEAHGLWIDSGGGIMASGGNFQIKVSALDARCQWRVAVYPS